MWQDERALVALSRRECLDLLRGEEVGRVVFTERALPAILPISYALLHDDVILATASDSRLAEAARGGVLAFEVDHLDPATRTGWSVVVTGMPEYVVHPLAQAQLMSVLDPWAPGRHDLLLRLPVTVVTGRRIEAELSQPPAAVR
jgi:nitroimidazol reductase NimA-like FMN-containing flavoprotein (pyridoxamine 5'-phosphate oxidase superfamily)